MEISREINLDVSWLVPSLSRIVFAANCSWVVLFSTKLTSPNEQRLINLITSSSLGVIKKPLTFERSCYFAISLLFKHQNHNKEICIWFAYLGTNFPILLNQYGNSSYFCHFTINILRNNWNNILKYFKHSQSIRSLTEVTCQGSIIQEILD